MSYWCEECQGGGRIMDKTYEAGLIMKDCPACNGTGVIKHSTEILQDAIETIKIEDAELLYRLATESYEKELG